MAPLFPAAVAAEDFQIGQLVRWYVSERQLSPYVGKVVSINPAIQKVDVVFPIGGRQQRAPEELIPVTMFADFSSNVSPSSAGSNFYTSYQDDQNVDYSVKGVSGLYKKVASNFLQKLDPIFKTATFFFNSRVSKETAKSELLKKYAHKYGEGSIFYVLDLLYQKTASGNVDYSSILLILQDALSEQDEALRQNKIKDAFAIVFNGTGANVFVQIDDLLDEAYQCYEEESIMKVMRRAVGRAGGDIKKLNTKEESKAGNALLENEDEDDTKTSEDRY